MSMGGPGSPTADLDAWVAHYEGLRSSLDAGTFTARAKLRGGPLGTDPSAPPDPVALGALRWLHVRRLAAATGAGRPVLIDVLSSVVRLREPVTILLRGGDAGAGLHLGLAPDADESAAWIRSVLAPGSLLDPVVAPSIDVLGRTVNGLRFRLVPGRPGASTDDQPTALPGLARLLLAPGAAWAVILTLDPVPPIVADRLRRGLMSAWTVLGGRASATLSAESGTARSVEDPDVQGLIAQLSGLTTHLEAGDSAGLWHASIHVAGSSPTTANLITSVTASMLTAEPFSGGYWVPTPSRCHPEATLRPGTLISTADLATLLTPPAESVTGLDVSPAPPAGRVALPVPLRLELGTWSGTDRRFALDVSDLEGHAFVTGTTGSGKSNTVRRLLVELWNEHHIPFLVVDPVKADYDAIAPALRGGLVVVDATALRANLLQPIDGFPVRTHLELVANAVKGSFSLPSPVPYVVAQLFELLADRAESEPPPTLHELKDLLEPFVASLGYDAEVSGNIRAALGTRLSLLLAPAKAERVAAGTNTMIEGLLRKPSVVTLAGLGDDEERAFLMSMLTLYVFEHARGRGSAGGLSHVTVLEEAHRILPEPQRGTDPESGDPASVSARLLTQLLTEIRSYGESLVVVDQSPGAVARDVVKNTNLTIAHRILDAEDRGVVASGLGIADETAASVGRLAPGEAVVLSRRLPGPQTVMVQLLEPEGAGRTLAPQAHEPGSDPRGCCSGTEPVRHHAAEALSREAESTMALVVAGLMSGVEKQNPLWNQAERLLLSLAARDARLVRSPDRATQCLAWVGLRRSLLQYVGFGALPADDLGKHLDMAFLCWTHRSANRLFRLLRDRCATMAGPYPGCRHCDTRCRFRHVAAVSEQYGPAALQAALDPVWREPDESFTDTIERWRVGTSQELGSAMGVRDGRGLALCTVTRFLALRGAPPRVEDALLERVEIPEV